MILSWMSRLLGEEEQPKKVVVRERRNKAVQKESMDLFRDQLLGMLHEHSWVPAGQINMLNLERLKQHFGARWDEMEDSIREAVTQRIRSHMDKQDIFAEVDELEFVVVFAHLDEQESKIKLATIASEIYQYFLGEPALQDVNISTGLKRVDGKIKFKAVDAEGLMNELRQAKTLAPVATAPRPEVAESTGASHEDKPATIRPMSEDQQPEEHSLPPVESEAAGARPKVVYKGRERAISYSLRAVWNVHKCVIAANHLNTLWQAEDGQWQRIPDDLGPDSEDALCRIDCLAARQAGEAHAQAQEKNFPMLLVLPIHIQSLGKRRNRDALGRLLKTHVAPYARLTLIELCGVTPEMPVLRIGEVQDYLRSTAKGFLLRTTFKTDLLSRLKGMGFLAVGQDLDVLLQGKSMEDASLLQVMDEFARKADQNKQGAYLFGVHKTSQLLAATAAGYDFLDLDRLDPLESMTSKLRRYDWEYLYRPDAGNAQAATGLEADAPSERKTPSEPSTNH
ncbi:hypothetical protein [Fodinicurvata sediminis]|uniref:hypothetical protein n=1 Tax=Fodinicurvata sediminis TaxID=1121832 RepID=UPI0003B6761F|nr:hypothetical protein [Fodinicurvata sediminis]